MDALMSETPGSRFPDLHYGILHELVGHLLRHSYNRAAAAFESAFGNEALTPLQFMIFELIENNPGVSHSDISKAMGTAASVVTTTMKPMLVDGRIASAPKAGDSRQRVYEATPAGLDWFRTIRPKIEISEDELTRVLTPRERAELLRILRLLLGIERKQP